MTPAAAGDRIVPPARYVELLNGVVRAGQLAGTAARHPFAPDEITGSSCRACYGWVDDPRHLTTPAMPTVGIGGRRMTRGRRGGVVTSRAVESEY